MVNSISSFKRFIPAECRYLFRDTVCTLNLYHCSAADKLIIDGSIFFAASIISFWAFKSISSVASSFNSPKIAFNGVNHGLISLIYSGRPIFLLARFIASNKSGNITDFFPVSKRVNRILLSTESNPLLDASFRGSVKDFAVPRYWYGKPRLGRIGDTSGLGKALGIGTLSASSMAPIGHAYW
jgi:hypothetical protein